MTHTLLRLFLCACLLLGQLPLFAAPFEGRGPVRAARPAAWTNGPAKTDYLGNQVEIELRRQIGEAEGEILRAKGLDVKAREALKKGDAAEFYLTEKELNTLLIAQLSSRVSENRLYALERLAANIKEGLISPEDEKTVYALLENFLRAQETCGGKFCDVIGMSILTLALSVNVAEKPSFSARNNDMRPLSAYESKRLKLNALFSSLLKQDYGSAQASNAVDSYALRALAYTGGASAVQQAQEDLIKQSQKISVLWGAANISTQGLYLHLNKYGVPNAPAQKAAMQVLASLGDEGKKVLEYYATENRSLASYVHANIELAYMGETQVPVQKNLKNLYCNRKWDLDAQKDFVLRQEMAYAYGQGRAPAYVSQTGDNSCLVLVPQRPDPRLQVKAWTDAIGAEVLFNAAFIGAGNLFKILRHAKALRAYTRTHHGMSLKEFYQSGRRLPQMGFKTELKAEAKTRLTTTTGTKPSAQKTAHVNPYFSNADFLDTNLSPKRQRQIFQARANDWVERTARRPDLNAAQRAHVERLKTRMTENPTSAVFGEVERELKTLPGRKDNALVIYGTDVETDAVLLDQLRKNFMADQIGFKKEGAVYTFGQNKSQLYTALENYGRMSDDVFIRLDMHGGPLTAQSTLWQGALNTASSITMPEIASSMQQLIRAGDTKNIVLFIDSCFPDMALSNFLALPQAARKGISVFAPGGFRQLNYIIDAPKILRAPLSPLQYARTLWREGMSSHALTGRAYVNGRIIRPIDDAIKNASLFRPSAARQLEGYRALADAKTPLELRKAFYNLQERKPDLLFSNADYFMDDFSLFRESLYNTKSIYNDSPAVFFPKHLADEVRDALDKIVF